MDAHYYEFSGQATCLLITSRKRNKFTKFHFFGLKPNGIWEKPEKNEGREVRLTLYDLIKILNVLEKEESRVKEGSPIEIKGLEISWGDDGIGGQKDFWFHTNKFSKMLNYCQALFLKYLLRHIIEEKIEFSTRKPKKVEVKVPVEAIRGIIEKGTDNALLINIGDRIEHWIPKSTVHSKYDEFNKEVQKILIDTWILRKEKIIH